MQRDTMSVTRSAALLLPLLSLLGAGCTLVDQRTFNPQAGAKYTPPVTGPVIAPVPPLVTVDYGHPDPDYAAALHQAVAAALARKADVQFDVVTVVPSNGTTAQQVAAASGLTANAREIARAINNDGVDDDRIHLLARAEAGVSSRQIQVFVH